MTTIRKLPADLINQIAAGEVIERPASAMKELVENALDAGAPRIEVALEDGGRRLIRVADDGAGMGADDLPLAVASHATSKIANLDDLFHIRTLGFRGEALASIGSIAELRVASRQAEGDGHEIEVRGGATGEVRPAGVAKGTTVEVRNLFFNTPARRKFLRDGGGELRQCVEALTRVALAKPGVAFRLAHEGRLVFETTADPAAEEGSRATLPRIADLFGSELARDLVPVSGARGAIRLGGYVALPRRTRGDSTQQFVSLNGRAIRDKLVGSAVREAYQGFLMTRRFPVVFLELEAEPDAVDVNVHPAKLEVRFRESRDLFALIVRVIRGVLEEERIDPVLAPAHARVEPASRVASPAHPEPASRAEPLTREERRSPSMAAPMARCASIFAATSVAEPRAEYRIVTTPPTAPVSASVPVAVPDAGRAAAPTAAPSQAALFDRAPAAAPAHLQLGSGYLVVETPAGFEVLDPHALHERILYEELRTRIAEGSVELQALLIPELVELSAIEEARLDAARESLAAIGLVVEPFGPRTAAIQAVPAILRRVRSWDGVLRDLLGGVDDGAAPSRSAMLEHLTATMACKAAVKLGERLKPDEVAALLARRATADRSHLCPHGRPTALAFPAHELERQFKR